MKYSKAQIRKSYVIRLEDKEIVQDSIEAFARKMKIKAAVVQLLGGVDKGSKLIVGPRKGRGVKIEPVVHELDEMHEAVGNGTIFCDEKGQPGLHCHLACGRGQKSITGEIRAGVIVWHVMEVIITEFKRCSAIRKKDSSTGFELLMPEKEFIP